MNSKKFLRKQDLRAKVPVSYPTIWRWEKAGKFPARRRLGPNIVGWLESEVDEWIASRTVAHPAEAPRAA
jgi:prophage regulatory protein